MGECLSPGTKIFHIHPEHDSICFLSSLASFARSKCMYLRYCKVNDRQSSSRDRYHFLNASSFTFPLSLASGRPASSLFAFSCPRRSEYYVIYHHRSIPAFCHEASSVPLAWHLHTLPNLHQRGEHQEYLAPCASQASYKAF